MGATGAIGCGAVLAHHLISITKGNHPTSKAPSSSIDEKTGRTRKKKGNKCVIHFNWDKGQQDVLMDKLHIAIGFNLANKAHRIFHSFRKLLNDPEEKYDFGNQ